MRIKRGVTSHSRHHKIKVATKGMTRPNRSSIRRGRQTVIKGLQHAYRDRRNKKRTFRSLWNARINAGAKANNTSYSKLIHGMKLHNIEINRKMLSELAVNEPEAFTSIVKLAVK